MSAREKILFGSDVFASRVPAEAVKRERGPAPPDAEPLL
jgi:hypothetical protein